jgi:hypothetical protein
MSPQHKKILRVLNKQRKWKNRTTKNWKSIIFQTCNVIAISVILASDVQDTNITNVLEYWTMDSTGSGFLKYRRGRQVGVDDGFISLIVCRPFQIERLKVGKLGQVCDTFVGQCLAKCHTKRGQVGEFCDARRRPRTCTIFLVVVCNSCTPVGRNGNV